MITLSLTGVNSIARRVDNLKSSSRQKKKINLTLAWRSAKTPPTIAISNLEATMLSKNPASKNNFTSSMANDSVLSLGRLEIHVLQK